MGKYVKGFNRFYDPASEKKIPYATAGLSLFCRYHEDFQVDN